MSLLKSGEQCKRFIKAIKKKKKKMMLQYLEHLRSLWCQLTDSSGVGVLAETWRVVVDIRDVDADDGRVAERR